MAEILKYVTDREEARMLAEATRERFEDGAVIVAEGQRTRALFILRSGEARVERAHGEFSVEISRLRPGELFGEMGFVEDFHASASVIADGPCEVDVVDDAHVHAMTEADPAFGGRFYHSIAELLSRRLRATSVEALSEFSWGPGGFTRPRTDSGAGDDASRELGLGSPLRDADDGG